jgi:hypothetical protein
MIQVADQLGIHVATVSRAVSEKWIQTPRGVFPLRRFFSGGTQSADGEDMSWDAVKEKLKIIIDHEDKNNPLNDDEIVEKLKAQGIDIARRTVAKYRKILNIAHRATSDENSKRGERASAARRRACHFSGKLITRSIANHMTLPAFLSAGEPTPNPASAKRTSARSASVSRAATSSPSSTSAKTTSGTRATSPARFTWAKESSSATSKPNSPTQTQELILYCGGGFPLGASCRQPPEMGYTNVQSMGRRVAGVERGGARYEVALGQPGNTRLIERLPFLVPLRLRS